MIVLGITGQKRSGKDTVADHLIAKHGYTKVELPAPLTDELCILDPWCQIPDPTGHYDHQYVRFSELIAGYGVEWAKDMSPDVRAYQQRYGTDIIRDRVDEDRWVKLAVHTIEAHHAVGHTRFVIPNIRAHNEQALCDLVIRVNRPGHSLSAGDHRIEQGIDGLVVDAVIDNTGTLDQLHDAVDLMLGDYHSVGEKRD